MAVPRLTGPGAGVLKYDLLTALTVCGLHGSPGWQTSVMRLIVLVTARYNWQTEELVLGQRDMARMWNVNERTVKREIKRLTDTGVLICKRPGVRGRVAAYQLNLRRIAELSEPVWSEVGPDFAHRMAERFLKPAVASEKKPKVVALSDYKANTLPKTEGQGPWERVLHRIAEQDAALYQAWFSRLKLSHCDAGRLVLTAPSPFVARYVQTHFERLLYRAAEPELGPLERIEIQ